MAYLESRKTDAGFTGGLRKYRSSSNRNSNASSRDRNQHENACPNVLPHAVKARLQSLFTEIETEFSVLYQENLQLRTKISSLEKGQYETDEKDKTLIEENDVFDKNVLKSFTKNRAFKTRHKLKAHTSKIVSSFKTPSISCSLVKDYKGHKDGIWDISVSRLGHPLMGTASADKTARIWGVDSGRCLTFYTGHTGSVNGISFHPTQDLVLTASGDGSAHIWKASPILPDSLVSGGGAGTQSSEESADSSEDDLYQGGNGFNSGERQSDQTRVSQHGQTVKSPITTLLGHNGVVISCAWLNEDLAVTAGWDRVANLYNVETGALLQALVGHDSELTHVACHPTQRLVTTCSTDSTFRLWDFREAIHSVSVFQGHTESVTCAAFSRTDQIVSGSDDRSVKVWDLKNMRAPVASIQTQSAVNRLDISSTGLIAIPQDNRQIFVHDLNGHKLSRLPRDSTKSHHRMVSAVCWAPDIEEVENWRTKANLFSAGFDRMAFGWSVKPTANKDDIIKSKEKSKEGTF